MRCFIFGLVAFLMSAGLFSCDSEQEASTPGGSSAVPLPEVDWLPPELPTQADQGYVVLRLGHFSEDRLKTTLQHCLDQLTFEGDDAEFRRGMIEGIWSGLFDRYTYLQFLLVDHGIDLFAMLGPINENGPTSIQDLDAFFRTQQPDTHELAQSGFEMLDSKDEFDQLVPLDAAWSRVVWSAEAVQAEPAASPSADEPTPAPAVPAEVWRGLCARLPADASAYMVFPGLPAPLPPLDPSRLAEMPPEQRESLDRLKAGLDAVQVSAVTLRLGERPAVAFGTAFPDAETAASLAEASTRLLDWIQAEQAAEIAENPAAAAESIDALMLEVMTGLSFQTDGRFLIQHIETESLDRLIAETDPGLWQVLQLMAAGLFD